MYFTDINFVTIVIAAAISVGISSLWYARWAFGTGTYDTKACASRAVAALLAAFVLASLFNSIVVMSIGDIALAGFLLWLGFAAPVRAHDYLSGRASRREALVDLGFGLVSTVVMALVIALFS